MKPEQGGYRELLEDGIRVQADLGKQGTEHCPAFQVYDKEHDGYEAVEVQPWAEEAQGVCE